MTAIDLRVEPLVREALAAVIGQDHERLQRALFAFQGDDAMTHGVRLATAAALFVLHDLHEGDRPTGDELAEIAGDIASAEEWIDVTAAEIAEYLQATCAGGSPDRVLPMERVILLAFVTAANLLASYRSDDEHWWDFLDRAEAAIEAAS